MRPLLNILVLTLSLGYSLPLFAASCEKVLQTNQPLRALNLLSIYHGEEVPKNQFLRFITGKPLTSQIKYYDESQRNESEIFLRDGLLVGTDGNPISSGKYHLYVVTPEGEMRITYPFVGKLHHSSLVAGGPIFCGGNILLINGKIDYIDRQSGHYHPDDDRFKELLDRFIERGVQFTPDARIIHSIGD